MNLFRAEWSRLFARRVTQIMILVVLGVLVLIGVGLAASSHKPGPEAQAAARVQADRARAQVAADRARCEESQRADGATPGGNASSGPGSGPTNGGPTSDGGQVERQEFPPGMDCADLDGSWISDENFMPHAFNFRSEAPNLLLVFAGLLALFGFVIGASFVGVEWNSGGMMNLLLWRPQRVQVLATKLVAALAGVATIGVALCALWIGGLYAVAQLRGDPGRVTSGSMQSLALDGVRGLGLAVMVAALGFAVASLGQRTATALGTAVAWVLIGEVGLRMVLGVAEVARPERWLLSSYVLAWLSKKISFEDWTNCRFQNGPCTPDNWSISMGQAATVGSALLVLAVGTAMLMMQRRDIT